MARRVRHHVENMLADTVTCGRDNTYRLMTTDDVERVTCSRCRQRLIRAGRLEANADDEARQERTRARRSTASAPVETDTNWLLRVGIVVPD